MISHVAKSEKQINKHNTTEGFIQRSRSLPKGGRQDGWREIGEGGLRGTNFQLQNKWSWV